MADMEERLHSDLAIGVDDHHDRQHPLTGPEHSGTLDPDKLTPGTEDDIIKVIAGLPTYENAGDDDYKLKFLAYSYGWKDVMYLPSDLGSSFELYSVNKGQSVITSGIESFAVVLLLIP